MLQSRNKICVFAKLLTPALNWKLTEEPKLGQVEIENWFDIPRSLDKNGNVRLDLFAFVLKNNNDEDKIQVSQIVELIP
jgi:hypothetical protein